MGGFVQTQLRITCSWEIICHKQPVLNTARAAVPDVFSTSFEIRGFSAGCARVTCSKPVGFFASKHGISWEVAMQRSLVVLW